ncbi:hypothetical protein CU098_010287 [Rhizopus stolonifer]|uniref:Bromo domain-containing protein n=1 Tax=Rhizopus stolonifer TaxID=4846 RepID=A0A367KHS2_RHIST|nr:hypothetical protein CU098_010287 [Rhizopus stolonifer]
MSHVAQKRSFSSIADDSSTQAVMTPAEKKWCMQTIRALKKHKRAIAFLDPVDPIQFNIPDYFDIIKHPMDLGTVEKKLLADAYKSVDEFKADIQLMFDNCYLYNNPGDPVCLDAKKLEEHYQKLCKKEPSLTTEPHHVYTDTQSIPAPPSATTIKLAIQKPPSLPPSPSTMHIEPPLEMKPEPVMKTDPPPEIKPEPIVTFVNNDPVPSMPEDQFKRCEALVRELKKPKYKGIAWPFENPVDAAAWGATDYYDIIKQPMDMSTYEKKLYSHQYSHEEELAQDIRLMFRNCYLYNPPDHLVANLGKEFEAIFEKQWAKLHQQKDSKKKKESKRQRTSLEPPLAIEPTSSSAVVDHHSDMIEPTSSENKSNNGPTILRLKIKVSQPKEEPVKEPEVTSPPKPKIPGLALSKEPPTPTLSNNGPKLAIAKKEPPKPKETVDVKPFDIADIYSQIHNEKKLKEQQKREEQEKWERQEKLRLESERVATEKRMHELREQSRKFKAKKEQDKQHRLYALNAVSIDISRQKMRFSEYEKEHMSRDQDWHDVFVWQRDTNDYRHIPAPGFVKRAQIKLPELRKRLLSKCVRLENSKSNSQPINMMDDGGSDMDVE